MIDTVQVARRAVEIAADRQANNILLLDIRELTSFADYFVILTAESQRQMNSLTEELTADLKGLGAEAAHWITTEKDAVKILPSWGGSDRIRVVRESLGFEAGEAFVDWLAERLSGARG